MSEEANKPPNGEQKTPEDVIILRLERQPWKLTIDGQVESTNVALAMLQEAFREMETEWRIGRGIMAQQKLNQAKADQKHVEDLLNTTWPKKH